MIMPDQVRQGMLEIDRRMKAGEFGKLPIHLALGHEDIACALAAAMKPEDKLILTHRNIAYHLARGTTVEQLAEGYKGPFGSMNLINPDAGIVYTSSILGNQFPVAVGVALGCKGVVYCLGGDGSMEEGSFYESLVLAKATGAKVVFVIENNEWSMSSKTWQRRSSISLRDMAAAVGATYLHCISDVTWIDGSGYRFDSIPSYPAVVDAEVHTLGAKPNYHCGPLREMP